MIIRWTSQAITRPIKGEPYKAQSGYRRTLWLLFLPLFSLTEWSGR